MKKHLKLIIICAVILVGLLLIFIPKVNVAKIIGTDKMKTKVSKVEIDYVYNTDDPYEVTNYHKYVFVGRVESYKKTKYSSVFNISSGKTVYSVKVLENIKGELDTKGEIILEKSGGLIRWSDTFLVYKHDVLPAVGGTYLFVASVYDGELKCTSPGTVVKLESDTNYSDDEMYKKYVEACKNPKEYDYNWIREDEISRYDVNYKK